MLSLRSSEPPATFFIPSVNSSPASAPSGKIINRQLSYEEILAADTRVECHLKYTLFNSETVMI